MDAKTRMVTVLLGLACLLFAATGCGDDAAQPDSVADADADDADGGPDADADADDVPGSDADDTPGSDADADGDADADADADADGEETPGPVCPNAICEAGEGCAGCPADCGVCPGCPNGTCEVAVESCIDCEADCGICGPICGDTLCEAGETCGSCAFDCRCPDCPDGTCQAYESCSACEADCGICPVACGNGIVQTGEECDDGNSVSGDGCEPGCRFTCHAAPDCNDLDPCTEDYCDSTSHTCGSRPGPDGVTCGGGDMCTGTGTCLSGVCFYSAPMDCDDGNACTTDTCVPVTGCVHTEHAEGSACDDLLFCIANDHCRRGLDLILVCRGDIGSSPCDDGDACTMDICDESLDSCSHEPMAYRSVACGASMAGNSMGRSDTYHGIVCPDGTHAAPGADVVQQVTLATAGTLTVTVDTAGSEPGTTLYILTNACVMTSCLAASTSVASASVAAGTYYIVIDSTPGGGAYSYSVTCP